MSLSSTERSLLARAAAHTMHARHPIEETSAPGRRAFMDKFLREADPDGTLDPAERERRARHLRSAHFLRLAAASARARRRRDGAS